FAPVPDAGGATDEELSDPAREVQPQAPAESAAVFRRLIQSLGCADSFFADNAAAFGRMVDQTRGRRLAGRQAESAPLDFFGISVDNCTLEFRIGVGVLGVHSWLHNELVGAGG